MATGMKRQQGLPKSGHKCIPLCHPDNYEWSSKDGTLVEIKGKERTKLVTCKEALTLLRNIEYPVCPIAIVGDRRTGKSYIMSQLQEPRREDFTFDISSAMAANTIGIWMSGEPYLKTLHDGTEVAILLFDTEGLESIETMGEGDDIIFILTVLITSLLIYNGIGVAKAGDLNKLRCFGDLASKIQVQSDNMDNNHDHNEFFKFFPAFVWLLRDVTLRPKLVIDGKETVVDIETYLKEDVLQRKVRGHDGNMQVQGYADIGKAIMSYFPIFSAYALPPPAYNAELLHDPKNKSELNPDFLKKVEHFREMIATKLKPKCAWPGIGHVYGEQYCELVQKYIEALTTPGVIPNVQSTWSQILEAQFTKEIDDAEDEYKKNMEKDIKLPCDEMELQGKHKEAYDIAIKKFKHGTATIKNAEMSDQKMTELKERIVKYSTTDGKTKIVGGIFHEYIKQNTDASLNQCMEVAETAYQTHVKSINIQKLNSFKGVEDANKRAVEMYKNEAKGPKVNAVLQSELLQKISIFYFDNIDALRKLKDFKSPEMTKEDLSKFKEHLKNLELKDQVEQQQEMIKQIKESAEEQKQSLLQKREEQDELMRSHMQQLLENQKIQAETRDDQMRQMYEERSRHMEMMMQMQKEKSESEARLMQQMAEMQRQQQQNQIDMLNRRMEEMSRPHRSPSAPCNVM